MTLVLERRGRARAEEADVDGVEVAHAPGDGDDTIVAIAEAHREVIAITGGRELAVRQTPRTSGRARLLDQLVD